MNYKTIPKEVLHTMGLLYGDLVDRHKFRLLPTKVDGITTISLCLPVEVGSLHRTILQPILIVPSNEMLIEDMRDTPHRLLSHDSIIVNPTNEAQKRAIARFQSDPESLFKLWTSD